MPLRQTTSALWSMSASVFTGKCSLTGVGQHNMNAFGYHNGLILFV